MYTLMKTMPADLAETITSCTIPGELHVGRGAVWGGGGSWTVVLRPISATHAVALWVDLTIDPLKFISSARETCVRDEEGNLSQLFAHWAANPDRWGYRGDLPEDQIAAIEAAFGETLTPERWVELIEQFAASRR